MAARTSTSDTDVNIELIIEKLSTNGTEKLDPIYVKQLKTYCKSVASNQEDAYNYLGRLVLHQLEKNHAQIRFGSLLIIEYLFERAHYFREFVCNNLNAFFELCIDIKGFRYATLADDFEANNHTNKNTKSKKALQPIAWAKRLRVKAIECFSYWYNEFGNGYQALKNGYRFLLSHGVIGSQQNEAIPSSSTNSARQSQQIGTSDQRSVQQFQLEKATKELSDIESDVNVLVTQIDTCFDLLIPKFKVIEEDASNSSDNFHFRPMQGLSFSIILNSKVEIILDESNSDLINNLDELCQELNKIYKGKLSKFSTELASLKLPLFVDKVNELINNSKCLKVKIATIVWKFNEINIVTAERLAVKSDIKNCIFSQNDNKSEDGDEDDDDEFEDVPEREDLCLMRKIQLEKEKLIKEAEQSSMERTSKEATSLLPDQHQCRAPLPSGRLCPRRDKLKCPFHGNIISRDSEGLPLDAVLRQQELDAQFQQKADEWKDPKYLKQLSIQTGRDLEGKSLRNKRKKYPNLIDIKKLENTPRKRLMRKISSKKIREKVSSDLAALDQQVHQQYSQQWSYALEN